MDEEIKLPKDGHWKGDHWILKNGYCKADDGPCENEVKDHRERFKLQK